MNRRSFLKKIAAVAAGAVAVPAMLAAAPEAKAIKVPWARMSAEYSYNKNEIERAFKRARDSTKYNKYCWRWVGGLLNFPPPPGYDAFLYKTTSYQEHEINSWYRAADGCLFRYMRMENYAFNPKNTVHHSA